MSPLALVSAKYASEDKLVKLMIRRWEKSRAYCLAVFDAMPEEFIEFSPSEDQMTFTQHFVNLCFFNNMYLGFMIDSSEFTDIKVLFESKYLIQRPDDIGLFNSDNLKQETNAANKKRVAAYIDKTFDFSIATLNQINDEFLGKGLERPKPGFLKGHSNLDLILRGESHTAHHRGQAIVYLRIKGIKPPDYGGFNVFEE